MTLASGHGEDTGLRYWELTNGYTSHCRWWSYTCRERGTRVWAAKYKARKDGEIATAKAAEVRANERAEQAEIAVRQAQEIFLKRIGYEIGSIYYLIEFMGTMGKCKITHICKDMKITGSLKFPYHKTAIRFSTPGSYISVDPHLVNIGRAFSKPVELETKPDRNNRGCCEVFVNIAGDLTGEDPVFSYGYEYEMSNAFLMSREEVKENYTGKSSASRGESFFLANAPTYQAELEISFPTHWKDFIDPQLGVRLTNTEVSHEAEHDRIKSGRKLSARGTYVFTVDDPLPTCDYMVSWWPPPRVA
jgi:hypothetical protein